MKEILVIEDNFDEALLTQRVLESAYRDSRVHLVRDSDEALRYLHRRGPYIDAKTPDLVLLDFDLPAQGSRVLLERLKGDRATRLIPVVVLSRTADLTEIRRSYELHANAYVLKSADLSTFRSAIAALAIFWLTTVVLPGDDGPRSKARSSPWLGIGTS